MTIEEYLVDVREIYYQMSTIVKGKQILADGRTRRLTDVRDNRGALHTIRFSTLSLPASTKADRVGTSCAVIDFGGVHLVIWPIREIEQEDHIMTVQFWVEYDVLRARNVTPGSLSDTSLKWHALHALASSGQLVSDGGCYTCALCQAHSLGLFGCATCPIQQFTGLDYCEGVTPYQDYCRAVLRQDIEGATEAAKAMIEFVTKVQENEARQGQEDSNA